MQMDWESRYRSGDMPWEKGAPSPGLVEYLRSNSLDGKILVLGCGYGHDVRAIATPHNEVIGIDIAPSAVEGARAFPKVARESYQFTDLFNLPVAMRGSFDWVWEHTCFCAIDPAMRVAYVEAVTNALKPAGRLLAIFYLNPSHGGEEPPFGITTTELDRLFEKSFVLVDEWNPTRAYPGREGRELMRLLRKKT